MSSSGRTALVTGGNRGLGAAIARALDDAGHRVIITHTPGNDKVAAWLDAQDTKGYRFVAYGVDVGDWESTQALARQIQADGYHVDILVNNAGITRDATLRKMDKSGWDAVLRTNLDSMFNVTKPFIDPMVERGWGRIVNISSAHGLRASAYKSAYVAAKHALEGLSKVTALEGGPHGVTSNCINPAYVRTPLVEKQIADQAVVHGIAESEVVEKIMLTESVIKRLIEAEEVASLAGWLVSDRAGMVTGGSYTMDGGWTAR